MEFLHSKKLIQKKPPQSSAQEYLDIAEIKDGVVVLKNGGLRSIIMVSSINFALKSTEEQDAIVYHYQSFLNSLDFPIQILINSREINIKQYLEMIKDKEKEQPNELLRIQTSEYLEFIQGLVKMANIINKTFYITVPFSPVQLKEKNFVDKIITGIGLQQSERKGGMKFSEENFKKYKNQLLQRVNHILSGLSGIGLRMVVLDNQEIIEALYKIYNPGISSDKDILAKIEELDIAR
jgi:hypothetical protein